MTETLLDYHLCTDEDYAGFYPLKEQSIGTFELEKDKMYCLDEWTDQFTIGGADGAAFWDTVELIVVPCNYIH